MRTALILLISGLMAMLLCLIQGGPAKSETDDRLILRNLYRIAVTERGDSINMAMVVAERILARQPHDPLASAYKGSLLTVMGGAAVLPWNRIRYVNVGLDLMDEALAKLETAAYGPALEAEMLMVCGATNASVPTTFERERLARQQIAALVDHAGFGLLDRCCQAHALAIAAVFAHADGEADRSRGLLTRANAIDPGVTTRVYNERH